MSVKQSAFIDELSKCVRCGSCKALCPTYDKEALEAMGSRGRLMLIRGLLSEKIKPSPLLNERIFSCILCGACKGLCPLGVDIPEAIYYGRSLLEKSDSKRKRLRSLVKFSAKWPELSFRLLRMSQRILLPVFSRKGLIPFTPEIPQMTLRGKDQVYKVSKKKGRVAIFAGCSVNYIMPQIGESLIHVLKKMGYEVILPKGEVCCGAPLRGLGLEEEAVELAKKNLRLFSRLKVDAVLSLCPTCTLNIKTDYKKMTGQGLEMAMDISVFFNDRLGFAGSIDKTAVYHDPCHLQFGLGVTKEPRELIKKAGISLMDSGESGCCGFGGLFCLSYRDLSENLLRDRTGVLIDSRADTVVTSCPGCMLQLSRTITDRPVLHLIEVIEEAFCDRSVHKQAPVAAEPVATVY